MRSVVVSAFAVIVLLLVGLLGVVPQPSAASEGSPEPIAATPTPECDDDQLAAGEAVFVEPGQASSEVPPEGMATLMTAPEEVLYLSVVTLPPDACLGYRYRNGAIVLFVQEGMIAYTAAASGTVPDPVVQTGDNDPATDDVQDVTLGAELTVEAGHWVSQSSPLWYTFHNPGPGDATVAIASYVVPPWEEGDPCSGGCRAP